MADWTKFLFCILVIHASTVGSKSVKRIKRTPPPKSLAAATTTTTTTTTTATTTTTTEEPTSTTTIMETTAGIQFCEYEGNIYPLNSESKVNPCTWLYCDSNGQPNIAVQCCLFPCTRPVYVEDQCCPDCPYGIECEIKGTYYSAGSRFQIDGCTWGFCNEFGEIEMSEMPCPIPDCNNAIQTECCLLCPKGPGCEHNGTFHQLDECFPLSDSSLGICNSGAVVLVQCSELDCSDPSLSNCCSYCPVNTPKPLPYCEYNGTIYEAGSTIKISNCTDAYCEYNGTLRFESAPCVEEICNNAISGNCCNICPNGPGCEYNGSFYQLNSEFQIDPCNTGYCEDGRIQVTAVDCPQLVCGNIQSVPGECCPVCEPGCLYDGTVHPPGSSFSVNPCLYGLTYCPGGPQDKNESNVDPCYHAMCDEDGMMHFAIVDCFRTCRNAEKLPGQCCPYCPDGYDCEYDGQYYNASSTFHIYNCTYGYCNEYGYVEFRELNSSDCPPALCNNAVTDGCCPTCPKGPGCEYNGTFHELNSIFQIDPCKWGQCDASGTLQFAMAECAYQYCQNPKSFQSQCCPVCLVETTPPESLQYPSSSDTPTSLETSEPLSSETTQSPSSTEAQILSETTHPPSSAEAQISSDTTQPPSSTEVQISPETTQAPSSTEAQISPETTQAPSSTEAQISPETTQPPSSTEAHISPETAQPPSSTEAQISPETAQPPSSTEAQIPPETAQPPSSTEAQISPETAQLPYSTEAQISLQTTQAPSSTETISNVRKRREATVSLEYEGEIYRETPLQTSGPNTWDVKKNKKVIVGSPKIRTQLIKNRRIQKLKTPKLSQNRKTGQRRK